MSVYGFSKQEVDTEDFHLGFELTLPREMQEFLTGKIKPSQKGMRKCTSENINSLLDEHELALG